MSRHIITTRGVGRHVLFVSVASVLLAGCTSRAVPPSAVGQPSLSLAAPLTALGCTTTGSCIALGASGGASGPTTAAQVRNHRGVWSALRVPAALAASVDAASCAITTCFFGGTQSIGELLWSINADDGVTTALSGPPGGLVIRDLSCTSDAVCTVIDQAAHDLTRISRTTDAGRTWSAPRTLAWAFATSTVLDCVSAQQCDVATTAAARVVTVHRSTDAGATWRVLATPATWTALSSLHCDSLCTALVSTATGSGVATQSKLSWRETPLSFTASSMSCPTSKTCVVVGHRVDQSPAMAQWHSSGVRSVALTYVPTPLTSVACEPNVCVAVGASTTVSFRP